MLKGEGKGGNEERRNRQRVEKEVHSEKEKASMCRDSSLSESLKSSRRIVCEVETLRECTSRATLRNP